MNAGDIEVIVERHARREGPMLPILHDVQAAQGWITEADIVAIAHALNLSRAEVSGVVSFYHDFRRSPPQLPTLKLCRAEACQARGSEPLARWALAQAEGKVGVETVYCLGLCSVGPAAMLGEEVHARLDQSRMAMLLQRAAG